MNICVLSNNPTDIERLLLNARNVGYVFATDKKEIAFPEIKTLKYDLLLVESVLFGGDACDFIKALAALNLKTPPYVAYLIKGDENYKKCRSEPNCDIVIEMPVDEQKLDNVLKYTTDSFRIPYLGKNSMPERKKIAAELLKELGMNTNLKGSACIVFGAVRLSYFRQKGDCDLKKRVYPFIAEEQTVSWTSAERNIRTAIEACWLKGKLDAIQALFGFSVDANRGKPTNAEFLYMLAQDIQLRISSR